MDDLPIADVLPLYATFIVASWFGSFYLISKIGGWCALARKFRCDDSFLGSWKGAQWGRVGSVSYRGCLWIGLAADGLHIKTGPFFLFRAFHPPLRIPWSAIKSVQESNYFFIKTVVLTLSDPPVKIAFRRHALDDARRFLGDKMTPQPGKSIIT